MPDVVAARGDGMDDRIKSGHDDSPCVFVASRIALRSIRATRRNGVARMERERNARPAAAKAPGEKVGTGFSQQPARPPKKLEHRAFLINRPMP